MWASPPTLVENNQLNNNLAVFGVERVWAVRFSQSSPSRYCQRRLAAFVKSCFFAQFVPSGENHKPRKSGKSGEGCRFFLCEPKMNIHNPHPLWKTPVEKSVENVENSELSTGISLLSVSAPSCGKVCIPLCIFCPQIAETACYVTARPLAASGKRNRKSLQNVKFRCHFLFPFRDGGKIFVKNRQIPFPVSSCLSGGILASIHNLRRYPCREK